MHYLLKRQLKKIMAEERQALSLKQQEKLLVLVDQAYKDADDDRLMMERSIDVSSAEMQGLYEQLEILSEQRIREKEEKYQRLVENLRNIYFFFTQNAKGEFIYFSDTILNILGYTAQEFLENINEYITEHINLSTNSQHIRNMTLGKLNAPFVLKLTHKNGLDRYVEVIQMPIKDDKNKLIQIEGIVKDITSEINAKTQLDYLGKHDSLTGISNRDSRPLSFRPPMHERLVSVSCGTTKKNWSIASWSITIS